MARPMHMTELQNTTAHATLRWITSVFKKHAIPFQINGGLAAQTYGAIRPLYDIDVRNSDFPQLKKLFSAYIVSGPERIADGHWELELMTLNHNDNLIDLAGTDDVQMKNGQTQEWVPLLCDIRKGMPTMVLDIPDLPVIPQADLIAYKNILARPTDLVDIEQMKRTHN